MARLSTSQLRQAWAPPCQGPWARVTLYGGAVVSVDPLIVHAVLALSGVFERHGYRATPPDTGAYNCRRITGGSGYSLHAYGIAVDVNWLDNPYGPRLVTDMPRAMTDEVKALRTVSGHQVWGWGGDYASNKDAMHFEIVCTPSQLASGIRAVTTPTVPPAGRPDPKEWTVMASEAEVKAAAKAAAKEAVAEELEAFGTKLIATLTGSAGVKPGTINDPKNPSVYDTRTVARDVLAGRKP